jgi:HEAT repeat protein
MLVPVLARRCGPAVLALLLAAVPALGQEKPQEADLIAVLKSDAPDADKAITCKRLAIYGSKEAVPELAKLLSHKDLASWARIALEAIPGAEADEALIDAVDSLEGRLLVGAINSIGVRHPEKAVDKLIAKMKDDDADVASAAAVALGHIGNDDATQALRKALSVDSLAVRSAAAEGCVFCAEKLFADGDADQAIEIYDQLRQAELPKQRILEATRGAILARKDAGIKLLVEQLRANDRDLFRIGLGTAREFPGDKVDQALAEELQDAEPAKAALIVTAMADRPETVKLPAVLAAAEKGPKPVRLAALSALGRIGNETCLGPLLDVALEADEQLVASAKQALSDLPGESVNDDIAEKLDNAKGRMYPLLIELVGKRRISAVPKLIKALDNDDKEVRAIALSSLGATVPPERLSVLIDAAVKPKHREDADAARQALKEASVRMPDREVTGAELAEALEKAPAETKTALLEILGAVGGTNALNALGDAAKSDSDVLQDVSTKLLGEWMTADAAPVLLDLTRSAPGEKYQTRAFRGYVRIARLLNLPRV